MLGLTKAWYRNYSGTVVPFNSGGGGIELPENINTNPFDNDTCTVHFGRYYVYYYADYKYILFYTYGYRTSGFTLLDTEKMLLMYCNGSVLNIITMTPRYLMYIKSGGVIGEYSFCFDYTGCYMGAGITNTEYFPDISSVSRYDSTIETSANPPFTYSPITIGIK